MSLSAEHHTPEELTVPVALPVTSRARREPRVGDLIAGRYRLEEVIGRGGMAGVYRARDERLQRDVAVKISCRAEDMPPPPLREELVTSALVHPNIVAIFDGGEVPAGEPGAGASFIVMEYVPGKTAAAVAPLPWRRAVDVLAQACDGLAAAHARGIVHCDVKPGNILIDRTGRVRVVDFGVAASTESEPDDYVHGSPAYIAPERLRGERPDPRMDVYGLGGVLAYLLTGAHLDDTRPTVTLPDGCPPSLADVIARARAEVPDQRFRDAEAFKHALAAAAQPADDPAPAPDAQATVSLAKRRAAASETSRRSSRRHLFTGALERRWLRPVLVVALAALVLVAAIVLVPRALPGSSALPPAAASTTVPDVRGQALHEAVEQLAAQGMTVERVEVIYGPGPRNRVVAQQPPAGEELGDEGIVLIVRAGR